MLQVEGKARVIVLQKKLGFELELELPTLVLF